MRDLGNGQQSRGPGEKPVGTLGIVLIVIYGVVLFLLMLYVLIQIWPSSPSGVSTSLPTVTVTLFNWTFPLSNDGRLLILVAAAGALGASIHVFRSLYWYVGSRELVYSWIVMYVLLPFVGAALGTLFYWVIRAGFFSLQSTSTGTNQYGFAALAALAGAFSREILLKLKQVIETLLIAPPPGKDAEPEKPKSTNTASIAPAQQHTPTVDASQSQQPVI
jgi:hypothetical protein